MRRPTLIATPPQRANPDMSATAAISPASNGMLDSHHRHQSFTVIPSNYSPESDNTDPDTSSNPILPVNPTIAAHDVSNQDRTTPGSSQPALSPGTFGAGVEEQPNPLEASVVWTPVVSQGQPASPNSAYSNLHLRRGSAITTGAGSRYSAVPSFVHDFPSPPAFDADGGVNGENAGNDDPGNIEQEHDMSADEGAMAMTTAASERQERTHESAFGQVVTGPPGAGKTTYCHGMHQVRQPRAAPVEKEQWWA